jgi:hypothetical protein
VIDAAENPFHYPSSGFCLIGNPDLLVYLIKKNPTITEEFHFLLLSINSEYKTIFISGLFVNIKR